MTQLEPTVDIEELPDPFFEDDELALPGRPVAASAGACCCFCSAGLGASDTPATPIED